MNRRGFFYRVTGAVAAFFALPKVAAIAKPLTSKRQKSKDKTHKLHGLKYPCAFPVGASAFLPVLGPDLNSGLRCEIHWDGHYMYAFYDGKRYIASEAYLPVNPPALSKWDSKMPKGTELYVRETTKEERRIAITKVRKDLREHFFGGRLSEKELREIFPGVFD